MRPGYAVRILEIEADVSDRGARRVGIPIAVIEEVAVFANHEGGPTSQLILEGICRVIDDRRGDPAYMSGLAAGVYEADTVERAERTADDDSSHLPHIDVQLARIDAKVTEAQRERQRTERERGLYLKAITPIEAANPPSVPPRNNPHTTFKPSRDVDRDDGFSVEADFAAALKGRPGIGPRNTIEIERTSEWKTHPTAVAHNVRQYAVDYRTVQRERCVSGDTLIAYRSQPIVSEEWRKVPVLLEGRLRDTDTGVEVIFPVALFTPHGADNQRCSVQLIKTENDGTTTERDLDVLSETDAPELSKLDMILGLY